MKSSAAAPCAASSRLTGAAAPVAGGIVTTPRDYMSFLGALTRGELLEPTTLDEMLSNAFPLAAKSGILAIVTARVRCLTIQHSRPARIPCSAPARALQGFSTS